MWNGEGSIEKGGIGGDGPLVKYGWQKLLVWVGVGCQACDELDVYREARRRGRRLPLYLAAPTLSCPN